MRDSIKLTEWDNGDLVDIKVADILSVFVSLTSSPYEGCTIIVLNQPNTFIVVNESHKDVMTLIQNDHPAETYTMDDDTGMCTLLYQGEAIKCYVSEITMNEIWTWGVSREIRQFEIIEV